MANNYISSLITCLFFLSACSSEQKITVLNNRDLIDQFKKGYYKLYYKVNHLDSRLVKYMERERNYSLHMVDTGKIFNPSDMVIKNFPNKRLIVAGAGSDSLNFILFEYGENMSHHTCVIYRKLSHKAYIVSLLSVSDSVNTFDELQKAVVSNSYRVE